MNQEPQKRLRLAVLLSGQGSNAEALAMAAEDSAYPAEIVLVASDKPEAAGLAKAQARGLATWAWHSEGHKEKHREQEATRQDNRPQEAPARFDRSQFEAELLQALDKHQVEALALAGFMRILSADFLAGFADTRGEKRIINIHPSLLPKFRGLHAPAQALAAGAEETGATVHLVTAELDAGAILAQATVQVQQGDTPELLHRRIQQAEHCLYPEAVAQWAERLQDKPKPANKIS